MARATTKTAVLHGGVGILGWRGSSSTSKRCVMRSPQSKNITKNDHPHFRSASILHADCNWTVRTVSYSERF